MRRVMLVAAVLFTAAIGSAGADKNAPTEVTADDAVAASVTVSAEGGTGSGVVFKNGESSFVWTDAHVVADAQRVRTAVDPQTGKQKVVVTYSDVSVVTEDFQGGRKVGETRRLAKVVRYGEDDDLAVLLVYEKGYGKKSAKFGDAPPKLGAAVWHVGSFHGKLGANSVSEGVVGAVGRLRKDFGPDETNSPVVFDQATAIAHHGSSGGGVFLKSNGECLGLVSHYLNVKDGLFTHGSFCYSPARRMREFAKRTGCEWAVDEKVKVPDLAAIMAGRVTDDLLTLVPSPEPGARRK